MDISVLGIGWVGREACGCVRQGIRITYQGKERIEDLQRKDIFSYLFKNFARLDNISKITCSAVAFALKDAEISYAADKKHDMGIVGTNRQGSIKSDEEYFRDYIRCGRKLGRGNLFIYTLPSSPLGEAAIHFGLQGPLLYTAAPCKSLINVLEIAGEMILSGEASTMLGGMAEEDEAIYFVLTVNSVTGAICSFSDAMAILNTESILSNIINEFSAIKTC